ncbi:MAG: hypothetical protein Q7V01_09560 [Vicinamibacterales bacterium]|nr:hypothetical protein [Vicinamibacterales bacterium]
MRDRLGWLAGLLVAVLLLSSCSGQEPEPVFVEGRVLTVQNLTGEDWLAVEIWLNHHYRVTRAAMPAGERFSVPLDTFVAGFGQRFNPNRQAVQGIEVTATTTGGKPVRLVWGEGRRQ